MADRKAILKRLSLLLAMARGGDEEAERGTAADMLARYIRKHRITPAELAQVGAHEQPGFDTTGIDFGRNEQWPKSLGFLVARAQGCAIISTKGRIYFAGTDDRRAASEKQWRHIHQQMIDQYATCGPFRPKSINPGMWRMGFMMGCLKRLAERMPIWRGVTEGYQPGHPGTNGAGIQPPDSITTAIVLARKGDVDEYVKDHFETRQSKWRLPKERSVEAFEVGYQAANRLSLWPTPALPRWTEPATTLGGAIAAWKALRDAR